MERNGPPDRDTDGDAAANLLERRWFAAFKAASGARAECETLLESMAITHTAWNRARARLCELEAMRDALEEELEALNEGDAPVPAPDRAAMSMA
jgi:hypothetical protein